MDIRAAEARQHHLASQEANKLAARHRQQRDELVRRLRAEDPDTWTYTALAKAVGCGPELIAHIVKADTPHNRGC